MRLLIVLLLSFNLLLSAQNITIKGKVLDSDGKTPLPKANVTIVGAKYGAATNLSGEFLISGEFDHNSSVKISYVGYKTLLKKAADFLNESPTIVVLFPETIPAQTVLIQGLMGKDEITPLTYSIITSKDVKREYGYQDIPEFLDRLPSTMFYSENGNGVGYNYLSIRGFDQRRISVSINGVPQNDPEDHNVYWLDFPDLLANAEFIQVQRGAGNSIVGYNAIGGAINIITNSFTANPSLKLMSGAGSNNTRKYSAFFQSGLIEEKYSITAKLSKLTSSGYRERSWADFNSYYISGARFDKDIITQINFYGGPISDGLAYTGLPKFTIKDRALRKENYSDWYADNNGYTFAVKRREEEMENFSQPHFELLNEIKLSESMKMNSALFLVIGEGFFDYDAYWADTNYFRITQDKGFAPTGNPEAPIIRAYVKNVQYGWMPKINLSHNNGELIIGGEIRRHNSLHWGSVNYAANLPSGVTKDYKYYEYNGAKDMLSVYANEQYKITDRLALTLEGRLAYFKYRLYNEKYIGNDFSVSDMFFNPRLGTSFLLNENSRLYFNFARSSREPRLKNYYDAAESSGGEEPQFERDKEGGLDYSRPLVKPETMNNLEFGYGYNKAKLNIGANYYYMFFENEIVKKGQVDRFGQPITGNMKETIHHGVELFGGYRFLDFMELTLNASYSQNFISNGSAFIKYKDISSGEKRIAEVDLKGNKIGGFPNLILNGALKFNLNNIFMNFSYKYVGGFYSDNYYNKLSDYIILYPGFIDYNDNKVEPYFVVNIYASYETKINSYLPKSKLYLQINNIFDNLYAAYAIGKQFFPAAERNYFVGIEIEL